MVPSGHRRDVAHETTALIREAIARVPLPKLDEIPDEDEMAARVMAGKSLVYRVPNTPFEIARTDSGPDTGRYQFTQKTVDQARDFYEEIKAYPFQPEQADIKGLYEAYFLSPGPLGVEFGIDIETLHSYQQLGAVKVGHSRRVGACSRSVRGQRRPAGRPKPSPNRGCRVRRATPRRPGPQEQVKRH